MSARLSLPKPAERLALGNTSLKVSPVCLGITATPDTVIAAFEAGINFFLLSADLHWPLYEQTRIGLSRLIIGGHAKRNEIVVAGVSYIDETFFRYLQLGEIIDSVPGLERIDILVAGGISTDAGFSKIKDLQAARSLSHVGASAIGASFHTRRYSLDADRENLLDIHYVRYNTGHTQAREDLFPHFRSDRSHLTYGFNSTSFYVTEERFRALGFSSRDWFPEPADYYRFVLTQPGVDGILCSPRSVGELNMLRDALDRPPLTPDEENYMTRLFFAAYRKKHLA